MLEVAYPTKQNTKYIIKLPVKTTRKNIFVYLARLKSNYELSKNNFRAEVEQLFKMNLMRTLKLKTLS